MAGLYSGLYVAGASLVCFCLILYDIIMAGFRKRRRWLPCHRFSLNSITLTILTAAVKITADLTTSMPSHLEQLSKLTSTAMLCTCVCFLSPSLGINGDSENWQNMLSLSILIITVIVNICIQMRSDLVVLFKAEHIIIMCFMVLLLLALMCLTYDIIIRRGISLDKNKDILKKGEGSMLKRLKLCFVHAYAENPQLELCRDSDNMLVNFISLLSSVVVIQATFRHSIFKELKLSSVVSDYGWSIVAIVVTQFATIVTACFGTSFRLFTLATLMSKKSLGMAWAFKDVGDAIMKNPIIYMGIKECLIRTLMYFVSTLLAALGLLVTLVFLVLNFISNISCCCCWCIWGLYSVRGNINKKDVLADFKGDKDIENWDDWTRRKADKELRSWMEEVKKHEQLLQLLSRTPPSQNSLTKKLKDPVDSSKGYKVSPLSVVILARIASVTVPSTLTGSLLTNVLKEVFEVIQFVNKKIDKNMNASKFAEAAFTGKDLATLFPADEITDGARLKRESRVSEATDVFARLKEILLHDDLVKSEMIVITDFINEEIRNENFASIEELYDFMEQLFVDMLNELLVQLPNAIFKEIVESGPENHEDAIRHGFKVLLAIEGIGTVVDFRSWSYPIGTDITHLTADDGRLKEIDKKNEQLTSHDDHDAGETSTSSIGNSSRDALIQIV